MDDALLLSRYARSRDPNAFTELIRRHGGMVFGTCVRVIGDRQRAEDAAQECFLALAEQAGSIRHSLGAWLHRVALHIALREKRRARPDAGVDVSALPAPQVEAWRTLAPQLDAALDALPEDMRELVTRCYLGGATQAELAAELRVTQATISRRLQQAVARLRKRLDAHLDDQAMQAALGCALVAPPSSLVAACGRIGLAGHHVAAKASAGLSAKVVALAMLGVAIPCAALAAWPRHARDARDPQRSAAPLASAPAASSAPRGDAPTLAADAPPPPPAAAANPLLARLVTIDVSGWPLDRIVATLADQLSQDGGMQALPDGSTRRIDTRLEIMPSSAGWPLCDAVADKKPLGEVLAQLAAQAHATVLASDRIVLVSRPLDVPVASLIARLWAPHADIGAIVWRIILSGDAEAVAELLGALASPEMDGLAARDAATATALQRLILRSVSACGCSWQSWLPSGDQMRIMGALAPARAGTAAAFARCRALKIPVPMALLYLAGQVGGPELGQDLQWVANDPAAAQPGLPPRSSVASIVLATTRGWAIKALGRAGVREALPLIRKVNEGGVSYDELLAGIMALGECGLPSDADAFGEKPFAGAWNMGATAYVAAAHLCPQKLDRMFALPGTIHWGEADAFIGYPIPSRLPSVLAGATSSNWWQRWAVWKGTGRLDPAVVDAQLHARGGTKPLAPELLAILARDGDDRALDALIDRMSAPPGVFTDVRSRRIEDVAQELAARLPPARQARAIARLRATLDFKRVGDAELSMLRAHSNPALADELMAHWAEAEAAGGGAAPAILRALAQMRQDRARAFIHARLGESAGASLCRRALSYEDLADPQLRAALAPMLAGSDEQLAISLATGGLAAYADTTGAAVDALARHAAALTPDDLARLRANIRPTEDELPGPVLGCLGAIMAASTDAAVRHACVDFADEISYRWIGSMRVAAAKVELVGLHDRDAGVAAFAKTAYGRLMHPNPFVLDGTDVYYERLIMLGAMDVMEDLALMDQQLAELQLQQAQATTARGGIPAAPAPPGGAGSSNF